MIKWEDSPIVSENWLKYRGTETDGTHNCSKLLYVVAQN